MQVANTAEAKLDSRCWLWSCVGAGVAPGDPSLPPQPHAPLCPSARRPQAHPRNSVVAFKDNSSAIRGFDTHPVLPLNPGGPSALAPQHRDWDLLLTAETHNFPCAVAPYPGARVFVCLLRFRSSAPGRLALVPLRCAMPNALYLTTIDDDDYIRFVLFIAAPAYS